MSSEIFCHPKFFVIRNFYCPKFFATRENIAKHFLSYAEQVTKEIEKGVNVFSVNIETKLYIVKPLHARWLISFYDHMQNNRQMIIKSFEMAGIIPIATIEVPDEDPFKHL